MLHANPYKRIKRAWALKTRRISQQQSIVKSAVLGDRFCETLFFLLDMLIAPGKSSIIFLTSCEQQTASRCRFVRKCRPLRAQQSGGVMIMGEAREFFLRVKESNPDFPGIDKQFSVVS